MKFKVIYLRKRFLFYSILSLFICTLFLGCSIDVNNLPLQKKKPYNFYYTNSLAKNMALQSSLKVKLLDTNFYKEKDFSEEDINTINIFLKALKKPNFVEAPKDLPLKPAYKLFFSFNKENYVMDVYSEKYLTIYPWDGNYEMDFIDMTDINTSCNIFHLCKYLIPR